MKNLEQFLLLPLGITIEIVPGLQCFHEIFLIVYKNTIQLFLHETQNNGFLIPRVNILYPKSQGRSPRDEGYNMFTQGIKNHCSGFDEGTIVLYFLHYKKNFVKLLHRGIQFLLYP